MPKPDQPLGETQADADRLRASLAKREVLRALQSDARIPLILMPGMVPLLAAWLDRGLAETAVGPNVSRIAANMLEQLDAIATDQCDQTVDAIYRGHIPPPIRCAPLLPHLYAFASLVAVGARYQGGPEWWAAAAWCNYVARQIAEADFPTMADVLVETHNPDCDSETLAEVFSR